MSLSNLKPFQEIAVADTFPQMEEVLNYLNIPFQSIPGQVSCPVHKFGGEVRKSARLYEDGLYCYTCQKQYRPTEIWAAVRELDRYDSAREINKIWVANPETVDRILKDLDIPKRVSLDKALLRYIEGCLKEYKYRVPLETYRMWALRVDSLPEFLVGVKREDRRARVVVMKNQMFREFEESLRSPEYAH